MNRTTSEALFTQRLAALLQQSTIEVRSHKRSNAAGRKVYDESRPSRATRRHVAATQRRLAKLSQGNKVEIKVNGVSLEAV